MLIFREGHHAVAQVAGGRMLKSLRRRPLEPPSSVTVTMAARSLIREGNAGSAPAVEAAEVVGEATYLLEAAQQGGQAGAAADGDYAEERRRDRRHWEAVRRTRASRNGVVAVRA